MVEEAKSLGKRILLSDLAVHREQAPSRGTYFSPDDDAGLAELLWRTWEEHSPEAEGRAMKAAAAGIEERRRAFAVGFREIVVEALNDRPTG